MWRCEPFFFFSNFLVSCLSHSVLSLSLIEKTCGLWVGVTCSHHSLLSLSPPPPLSLKKKVLLKKAVENWNKTHLWPLTQNPSQVGLHRLKQKLQTKPAPEKCNLIRGTSEKSLPNPNPPCAFLPHQPLCYWRVGSHNNLINFFFFFPVYTHNNCF